MDLHTEGLQATLTISDQGPGVDKELAVRLFQPFSAGDVRTGSGLGLAICLEIVQALGGRIALTNRLEDDKISGLDAVVHLPLFGPLKDTGTALQYRQSRHTLPCARTRSPPALSTGPAAGAPGRHNNPARHFGSPDRSRHGAKWP